MPASWITAAITQVAANKLKIKTDAKCDLGSSHCYFAFCGARPMPRVNMSRSTVFHCIELEATGVSHSINRGRDVGSTRSNSYISQSWKPENEVKYSIGITGKHPIFALGLNG